MHTAFVRCWQCQYQQAVFQQDREAESETMYCPRCGYFLEISIWGREEATHGGATTYALKGQTRTTLGAYDDAEAFLTWVTENRELLQQATLTINRAGAWVRIDALTGAESPFEAKPC
jgi:ribosomal protein S27E